MADDDAPPGQPELTQDDFEACVKVLRAIVHDRGALAALDEPSRRELVILAGRASRPDRAEIKKLAKALRRKDKRAVRLEDEARLESTGIRELRRAPVFVTPPPMLMGSDAQAQAAEPKPAASTADPRALNEPRKCYVCKAEYRELHAFYDQMCPPCAALNWQKRNQSADLRGRTAMVTGARVKIGYQAAMKLLRAGARVIVTTRFPRDAAERFAREADYAEFAARLAIYGLDLRHTPSVELFAKHLLEHEARLDFILHNACQTVRRPPGFYAHLVSNESAPGLAAVSPAARTLLADYEAMRHEHGTSRALVHDAQDDVSRAPAGLLDPAALSQAKLTHEDHALSSRLDLFPEGVLDQDLQQIDLRTHNSWRLTLAEVPTVELLEVQLVNAVAPFVLSARLKPLMMRTATHDKHIVNVSAMEGQFYRAHKTDKHPHTNMAKAALNMLTRTSAVDYARDGIFMNSVDTGWVTDEDPAHLAAQKRETHGFSPPLDIVDGAARICDPIFTGIATGQHEWGKFFKDYRETPW